ncbi:MAG: hypothetical protein IT542_04955 [Rubellimicrobium sp.]|nr:hypothetical protein [Rubellimicrobium sp.]
MSLLSRLFGGRPGQDRGPASSTAAEDHKGFVITPKPIREGGQFRVAALIEKDGRSHQLVRADTMASLDEAVALSRSKARQMIDEQGDRLFGA